MLLRCSKCKGAFEVEPNPYKGVVFCSHCGAPLQVGRTPHGVAQAVRKSGTGHTTSSIEDSSLAALAGNVASVPAEEMSRPTRRDPPLPAVFVEADTQIEIPSKDARTAADVELGALAAGAVRHPATSRVRFRKARQQKQSSETGIFVVVLVAGACLIVAIVVGAVIMMNNRNAPVVAPKAQNRPQPGEMFIHVRPQGGAESGSVESRNPREGAGPSNPADIPPP